MQAEALTIPKLLERRLANDGQRLAIIDDTRRLTYAELGKQSAAIAAFFIGAGMVKTARVGLLMENNVDWASIAVAAMRVGATIVPLSTFLRPTELAQQLQIAGVTHLMMSDEFRGNDYPAHIKAIAASYDKNGDGTLQDTALPTLRHAWRWSRVKDTALKEPAAPLADMVTAFGERVTPADDMAIIFTSGSSGAPKGTIHTHGGALRAVAASLDLRCITAEDRLYLPMPFFWTGGFATGLMSTMSVGATLLTESAPEDQRTLQFLARERVTLFRGWPAQAERIVKHPDFAKADLSSLKPGSLDAVMPKAQKAKSSKSRPVLFGMTETFGPYCGDRLDRDLPEDKWGSCGRPVEGVEVRIVDPATGNPVPSGTHGVIQVRGPNVMRGVCGMRRDELFDRDRFYTTGDYGYLDKDGYLYFLGRKDDMIKVKGATVYPSEVEEALSQVPGVLRAFVTDINGAQQGEREVGAAVVINGDGVQPAALDRALRERLSVFKIPSRWLVARAMSEIPVLASGKVDKPALRTALERSGQSLK